MRVLTQNLWGRRGDWPSRRSVIRDGLRELQPDLVSFQEAVVTDEYDQVRDLLDSEFHVVHQMEREPGDGGDVERGQGMSIASRWPIADAREVDLQVTARAANQACAAILAEIRTPEPVGALLFVNHLTSWQMEAELERELQAVATARVVEETVGGRDLHVVLAGDIGDADSASVRFFTGRQSLHGMSVCYRDAWESIHPTDVGETFTPRNPLMTDWDWPFRRVDLILVRCGDHGGPTLEIKDCRRAFDEPIEGVWASDHFGVIADLAPPQRDRR